MPFCPKCGQQYESGPSFCEECGASLAPPADGPGDRKGSARGSRGRGRRRRFLLVIGVAAVLALAALAVLWHSHPQSAPWPAAGGPYGNGQSRAKGPRHLVVKWKLGPQDLGASLGSHIVAAPVVGRRGAIYVGFDNGYLCAVTSAGKLERMVSVSKGPCYPAVAGDGTIYVVSDKGLQSVGPSGVAKWAVHTRPCSSAAVGSDGTVYVGVVVGGPSVHGGVIELTLHAYTPQGTAKWKTSGLVGSPNRASPLVAGADGSIYVTVGATCYAIDPNGKVRWRFDRESSHDASTMLSPPAPGLDGMSYVVDPYSVYALTRAGEVKWTYKAGYLENPPVIGPDGTVYVQDSKEQCLRAITPAGQEKWRVDGISSKQSHVLFWPCVGSDGTVYAYADGDVRQGTDRSLTRCGPGIAAVSPEGRVISVAEVPWSSPPAMGPDGTIYVVADDTLYAIGEAK